MIRCSGECDCCERVRRERERLRAKDVGRVRQWTPERAKQRRDSEARRREREAKDESAGRRGKDGDR